MMYRYALLNRPAGIGTIPRDLTYTVEPRPDSDADHYRYARHGILVTERALTETECRDFELIKILDRNSWAETWLVDEVANTMADYRADYIQQYQDDRNGFIETVLDVAKTNFGRVSLANDFPLKVLTWLASV